MSATLQRAAEAKPAPNPWQQPKGWLGLLSVISNQELGKMFMVTAVIFFFIAGLLALLMRTQLAVPENHFLGPEVYNRLFTMHGSTMMYLVVVPFLEGLGIYILPMLLGSRDVAFPYITAFSYWTYLFGGVGFYASFLLGAVPEVGWFAYPPLANGPYSGMGTDFWSLTLTLVSIGDLAAGAGLTVSVLRLRAPGMSINRMPLFAWAWLVTGVMITFSFTTLFVITTLMLPMDRTFGSHFFDPAKGGSALLWQHLFWFFGHPEVYIMFIPATGIVSAVVPVFARKPIIAYHLLAVALVLTAFVSFGLWVHHMFATGLPWLSMSFFTAASLMIAIASGVQVFAWIATLWGSRPALRVPLLYMVGFLFLFVIGGLTGVMVAIVPLDWQVHDTYFLVAHFHYVLIGGVVFPSLGGMYYWLPKISGRMLDDRLGKLSFWLTFLGFNLTFFPMHIAGFMGMPRRVYTYSATLGLGGLNMAETIGAYILAAGFLLFAVNALRSQREGPRAGRDPWAADTLEWLLDSPPQSDNHRTPPIVHSRHPLWTPQPIETGSPEEERVRGAIHDTPKPWRIALCTSVIEGTPEAIQPWPRPKSVAFTTSLGLTLILFGLLFKSNLTMLLGGVVTAVGLVGWYKPDDEILRPLYDAELDKRTGLPIVTSGPKSIDWWGLLFCLAILGTVYGNFLYSYFYIRLYSPMWPQDRLPMPDWAAALPIYMVLMASAVPQYVAARAFRADRVWWTRGGLAASFALALAFIPLLLHEVARQPFGYATDAYGSLFCFISWLLVATVSALLLVNLAAQIWAWRDGTSKRGFAPLLMERTNLLWAFTIVAGVIVYGVLYVSPFL